MAIDYRGLPYGQQYFPQEEVVDETVISEYPNKPFLYGDLNPYRSETEKFKTRFDPTQIQAAPEKRGFNFDLSGITGPVMGGLKWLGEKFQRPEAKQTAYDAIMGDRQGLGLWDTQKGTYGGNEYGLTQTPSGLKVSSDLVYNKNFDSMFGSKSLEEMEQKKIDWAMNRYNKMGRKGLSTNIFNALVNRGLIDAGGTTQKVPINPATTTGSATGVSIHGGGDAIPSGRHDYKRDRGGGYTLGGGFTGTRGEVGRTGSRAGEGRGHHSWRAEGGRVGLYAGGPPEMEEDTMTTMEFMQDQGIPFGEMASNPDPMAELNEFSLQIFKKTFDQLNDEERDMLFEMLNDQAENPRPVIDPYGTPQGEEIVEEGIASLV